MVDRLPAPTEAPSPDLDRAARCTAGAVDKLLDQWSEHTWTTVAEIQARGCIFTGIKSQTFLAADVPGLSSLDVVETVLEEACHLKQVAVGIPMEHREPGARAFVKRYARTVYSAGREASWDDGKISVGWMGKEHGLWVGGKFFPENMAAPAAPRDHRAWRPSVHRAHPFARGNAA